MARLAIDFDGVIHDHKNLLEGKRLGLPHTGAKEALDRLIRYNEIIVHTVKATTENGRQAVEEWLRFYHIPFTEITATKPNADIYLDDKALKHIDWETSLKELQNYL